MMYKCILHSSGSNGEKRGANTLMAGSRRPTLLVTNNKETQHTSPEKRPSLLHWGNIKKKINNPFPMKSQVQPHSPVTV